MQPSELSAQIRQKRTFLCVGLDTDPRRLPQHLLAEPDPVFAFNRQIIDATHPYAVAYKPNLAFYEAQGPKGWQSLQKTLAYIPAGMLKLADAKRGDIGNTADLYARTFFETFDFDAVTVAPYMGEDSVKPFLQYEGKWVFLLALTSNPGAQDFQHHGPAGAPLYERVLQRAQEWAQDSPGQLGFVVGATRAEALARVRELAPESFLLVPGVGAQGGDLAAVCRLGQTSHGGLLINSSRGIIYASAGKDFAEQAGTAAKKLQQQMAEFLP